MRENPNTNPGAEYAHIRICAGSRINSLLTDSISTGAIASHNVLMFNDPVNIFFSYRIARRLKLVN